MSNATKLRFDGFNNFYIIVLYYKASFLIVILSTICILSLFLSL